jgi:hypothetical protein
MKPEAGVSKKLSLAGLAKLGEAKVQLTTVWFDLIRLSWNRSPQLIWQNSMKYLGLARLA